MRDSGNEESSDGNSLLHTLNKQTTSCKGWFTSLGNALPGFKVDCIRTPVASELGNRVLFPFSDPDGSTAPTARI